ncbi:MAG: hypothetical protein ABIP75_18230 [Pyrinomonadaceae bacterium]
MPRKVGVVYANQTKRRSSTGYRLLTTGYLFDLVYDADGKLTAEYAQLTAPTTANIQYVTNNYQGSTSVVTDNGGGVLSRHDYLPFGKEIGAGVGSRTKLRESGDNLFSLLLGGHPEGRFAPPLTAGYG